LSAVTRSSFTRSRAIRKTSTFSSKQTRRTHRRHTPPLAAFGAPLENISAQDFADRGSFFRFDHDPQGIDILPDIPGVDFDAAWERRVESVIDTETGLKAFFISRDDLIAAKLASGRMRDLGDVEDIRAAAQSVEPGSPKKKAPETTPGGLKQ
jgi:hypothetical protein